MQLDPTSSVLRAATATSSTSTSGSTPVAPQQSSISITEFMQLLSAEMANQDPLKPMDPSQTMTQLAQFTSLQETTQLAQTQRLATGNSYLGAQVTVSTGQGHAPVTGTVTAVDSSAVASGGAPKLILNGAPQEYPLTDVTLVQFAPATGSSAAPTSSGSPGTTAPTVSAGQ